ncbi:hypothetical protein LC082_04020 [Microbacterium esteraromaticum]|uniref:hypothetical protein n=1 Tax=Microbacterium esteraromaticum TaxID=57043 RepID=UPI001CD7ADA1|nr:hypothetical protein [Microbacterium esteraromaticum]MCA1306068.1 hypothetical protein [Microbacterium esteraromaticum]
MIDLDDVDTDEDGALTATAVLPGERRVTVEYEFDEELERPDDGDVDEVDDDDEGVEPEDLPDLDAMQDTVQHALARLTEEILDGREIDVAEELADTAQEDDEDLDYDELLQAIREDLVLDGVIVFGDGGLTLLYVAASEFPDLVIYCLLDEDLEIDDLMVE